LIEARYGLVRAAAFLAVLLFVAAPARAAGFQYATAPDPDDQPLELAIWYPSNGKASTQPLGLFTQEVAYYGPVKGDHLPLVVISHGTGGSAAVHYDTALALADAGFVVVAPSHTGDNYKDRQDSFTARNFVNRARHIGRVVDFMTGAWNGHDHLDATRIGIFGHSAGAATALIVIGAEPDFAVMSVFCGDHPDDWGCQRANERSTGNAIRDSDAKPPQWQHDARVKAAVIATPAAGPGFTKDALAQAAVPVQLWAAENDRITPNASSADNVKANLPHPPETHMVANAAFRFSRAMQRRAGQGRAGDLNQRARLRPNGFSWRAKQGDRRLFPGAAATALSDPALRA
jgi:predicted dienelactone hydrolase